MQEETKKERKNLNLVIRILTLLAMWVFIFLMIYMIILVVKYKDEIRLDPLVYGMKAHNYTDCSCLDLKGNLWQSNGEQGFIHFEGETTNLGLSSANWSDLIKRARA